MFSVRMHLSGARILNKISLGNSYSASINTMHILESTTSYRFYFQSIAVHNIFLSCHSWSDHTEHFSWFNISFDQGHGRDAGRPAPRRHHCLIMRPTSSRTPSSDTIDRLIDMIFSRLIDYRRQAVAWYIDISDIFRLIGRHHRRVAVRLINARCVHGCQRSARPSSWYEAETPELILMDRN
jgi:hypothetical protein